jgi:uncharacterized membrane protein HdeD (DUF308 family)
MVLLVILGFWLLVGGAAAYVALFVSDENRAKRAFEVLKHVTRYGLGASALTTLATAANKATGIIDIFTQIFR